jgi:hypothetical protein
MRNVDMTPTSVRVLGSLAAISIAVTSIAALMVAPNVAVAAGAGAPAGGGETSTQSAPAQQKKSHAKKKRSRLKISSPATKPLTPLSMRKASTKRRSRRYALSIMTTMPTWRT